MGPCFSSRQKVPQYHAQGPRPRLIRQLSLNCRRAQRRRGLLRCNTAPRAPELDLLCAMAPMLVSSSQAEVPLREVSQQHRRKARFRWDHPETTHWGRQGFSQKRAARQLSKCRCQKASCERQPCRMSVKSDLSRVTVLRRFRNHGARLTRPQNAWINMKPRIDLQTLCSQFLASRTTDVVVFTRELCTRLRHCRDCRCESLGDDSLVITLGGEAPAICSFHDARHKLRMVCARIAALCNERTSGSVNPYGGAGQFIHTDEAGAVVCSAEFQNTPDKQWLALHITEGEAQGKEE